MFGWVALVHGHTINTSKLGPHFVKGVFISYSCMQKGFGSVFQISASMVSLLMSHSLSLLKIFLPHLLISTFNTVFIPYTYLTLFFLSRGHISSIYSNGSYSSLILSLPLSPTPLCDSSASPLLMPPTMSPISISTIVSSLLLSDSSTSYLDLTPIALPSNNLHLSIAP